MEVAFIIYSHCTNMPKTYTPILLCAVSFHSIRTTFRSSIGGLSAVMICDQRHSLQDSSGNKFHMYRTYIHMPQALHHWRRESKMLSDRLADRRTGTSFHVLSCSRILEYLTYFHATGTGLRSRRKRRKRRKAEGSMDFTAGRMEFGLEGLGVREDDFG